MSDYTPTLEDAKRTYAYIQGGLDHDEGYKPFYQVHEEAFDRMIAAIERAAAEKALTEAADELALLNDGGKRGLAGHSKSSASAITHRHAVAVIRARAEAYRQERGER